MRSLLSIVAIFLPLFLYSQSEEECLSVFYNSDSSHCGYKNVEGDTVVALEYISCFRDSICSFGMVITTDGQALAFNENGEFLYEVFWFDNGPDYLVEGMFRIVKDSLIGYANAAGEIVIEPQYTCAWPFENGSAEVSLDCEKVRYREHWTWVSDEWFRINKLGEIIQKE